MPHTFARAALALAIAFGTLVLGAGAAIPADDNPYPYAAINPSAGPAAPIAVPAPSRNGHTVVVVRDQPPLLTPNDLNFSTDQENGVTVVRGPVVH